MTYALVADKREKNSLLVSRGPGLYRQGLKHRLKIKPDELVLYRTEVIFYTKSSVKCM